MTCVSPNADKFSKLPEWARPTRYQIHLKPCLSTFEFSGHETIYLQIEKATNVLKLHASKLSIKRASLKLSDGSVLDQLNVELDPKWTLLTLHLRAEVQPQLVELELEFDGKIGTELQGFYRSPYKDLEGNEQWIASTQFASTYARLAFPCWDEPNYKSEFCIQIEIDQKLLALSNMNVEEEKQLGNGRKLVSFASTPPMSTYLVAFVIGNFDHIEGKSKSGCPVRVYALPGKKEKCEYALEVALKAIDWYAQWFGIAMPLPKCDFVTIPEFSYAAMENWGLVTFREQGLLYDPKVTSSTAKQRTTILVSHELAHFWFGNLVTMEWWTDLWLNEGFATFMSYLFTAHNYPEFNIWMTFISDEVGSALQLDALSSSHPIEIPIENPNELDEIFDAITYEKSSSILRTVFSHLGEPTFCRGMNLYLDKHKYANATTQDLWRSLAEASGEDVNELMSSWTQQMGYPLIVVEERQLEGNKRELRLSQRHFLGCAGGKAEVSSLWQVPISVATAAERTKAKFLLTQREATFVVENVSPDEWVKLNSEFTSFCRFQYPDAMLGRLIQGVKARQIGAIDRYELVNDVFALSLAAHIPIAQFLKCIAACCDQEGDFIVWQAIDSGVAKIQHVLNYAQHSESMASRFQKYICALIEPVAARYGWESKPGEDIFVAQTRALLLNRLAKCGHELTVQTALTKFTAFLAGSAELDKDLRAVVFAIAARTNDQGNVAALQHIFESTDTEDVKQSCILALSQCGDESLLRKIYEYGVVGKRVKSQDVKFLLAGAGISDSAVVQAQAWAFFKGHLQLLLEMYGSPNSHLFQSCMKEAARHFCSAEKAQEVEAFFATSFDADGLSTLDRPIRQIVESIKINGVLLKNTSEHLAEYLQKVEC